MVGMLEYRQQPTTPIMDAIARLDWIEEQHLPLDVDEVIILLSGNTSLRGPSDPEGRVFQAMQLIESRFDTRTVCVDSSLSCLDQEYDGRFIALQHGTQRCFGVEAIVRYLSRL